MYVATVIFGFTSDTRVTMPWRDTRAPMSEALTWRTERDLDLEDGLITTSLNKERESVL